MDKTIRLGLDTSDVKKEAKAAASALSDIGDRLKKLRAVTVTPKIELTQLQKAKRLIDSIKGTKIGSTTIGAGLASGASSLVGAARSLGETGLGLVVSGAKLAIHASTYRSEMEGVFAKQLGSSKAASKLYDNMVTAAAASGQSLEVGMKRAQGLLNAGFKFSEIPSLTRLLADQEKTKPGSSGALEKLFEKTKATGKFDGKAIKGLAKLGISTASIYDEVAKKLGKSRREVEEMFGGKTAGKAKKGAKDIKQSSIDAATGLAALEAVLRKRIGGVSDADSFADLQNGLEIMWRGMFDKVDMGGLIKVMNSALQILTGPEGKALKSGITDLFSSGFDAVSVLAGGGGLENQKKGLQGVAEGMHELASEIRGASGELEKLSGHISDVASKAKIIVKALSIINQAGFGGLKGLIPGSGVFELLGLLTDAADAKRKASGKSEPGESPVSTRVRKIMDGEELGAAKLSAKGGGEEVGRNMAAGVQTGIESGKAGIVSALVSACDSAVVGANSSLQIKSPSRRLFVTGAQTSAGLAGGIRSGMGAVASAMAAVSGSAAATANSNAYRATGTGGGGSSGIRNMASSGGSGGGVSATFHYHPPSVSVPQGASPADTKAHTEAASTGAMAAFQSHFTDALRGLQET